MQIRELMTADPEACTPGDSCAAAVGIMRRRNCGFVPVVDTQANKRLVGVVTDRDIALHFEKVNKPATEIPVAECMSRNVKWVSPAASLSEAAKLMEEFAIHRLPVAENGGRLTGVLSLKDIAVAADKRWALPGSATAEQKLGEIIESIASART
jgi:CBS domain-containing protein